jgi:hypothetical protein
MITCDKCNIRIEEDEYHRFAAIQPLGFWSEVVKVHQSNGRHGEPGWADPVVSWSSGGTDGTVTGNALTDNFIEALNHAKAIADEWRAA